MTTSLIRLLAACMTANHVTTLYRGKPTAPPAVRKFSARRVAEEPVSCGLSGRAERPVEGDASAVLGVSPKAYTISRISAGSTRQAVTAPKKGAA